MTNGIVGIEDGIEGIGAGISLGRTRSREVDLVLPGRGVEVEDRA